MRTFILLTLLLLSAVASAQNPPRDWVQYARKLIGESPAVRGRALGHLRVQFPTQEAILAELEGPHRHYALDVLVAFNSPTSADDLLGRLNLDRDGSFVLAVNALVTNKNYRRILDHYIKFLSGDLQQAPTPVVMAMVDFFTHLKLGLSPALFQALVSHPRMEVQQSAALHFAVMAKDKPELRIIIKNHMPALNPQVRAQILFTYMTLKDHELVKSGCAIDQNAIVQAACKEMKGPSAKKRKKK